MALVVFLPLCVTQVDWVKGGPRHLFASCHGKLSTHMQAHMHTGTNARCQMHSHEHKLTKTWTCSSHTDQSSVGMEIDKCRPPRPHENAVMNFVASLPWQRSVTLRAAGVRFEPAWETSCWWSKWLLFKPTTFKTSFRTAVSIFLAPGPK